MKGIGAAGRGGRRAASAAPAPIPPAAPPHPLGTLRGSDAQPALPRDTARPCALRPRRRSSVRDLGAARLPPGAAPRGPQLPGCGGQRAPRVRQWSFPPGSSRCSLCWQRGLGCGDAGFPGWPLESAEVLGRAPLWLHRENAPAPSSGCAFCFLRACLSKDPALWHQAFGRNC